MVAIIESALLYVSAATTTRLVHRQSVQKKGPNIYDHASNQILFLRKDYTSALAYPTQIILNTDHYVSF